MRSIAEWFRCALNRRRDRQYLLSLNGRGQADAGISSTDLHSLASAPCDTLSRIEAMATAHGIAPEALRREHWRQADMARACGHCSRRRVCSRWLAGERPYLAAHDFCPNALQFAEMASRPGSRSSS